MPRPAGLSRNYACEICGAVYAWYSAAMECEKDRHRSQQ